MDQSRSQSPTQMGQRRALTLKGTPVAAYVFEFYREGKTGCLIFESDDYQKILTFDRGFLVACRSNLPSESLRSALIRLNRLTPEDLDVLLDDRLTRISDVDLARLIAAGGLISEHELASVARVHQILLAEVLMGVSDGVLLVDDSIQTQRFIRGESKKHPNYDDLGLALGKAIDPVHVISEGIRKHLSDESAKKTMASWMDRFPVRGSDRHIRTSRLDFLAEEVEFLNRIDGTRPLRDLVDHWQHAKPRLAKFLLILKILRLVRFQSRPSVRQAIMMEDSVVLDGDSSQSIEVPVSSEVPSQAGDHKTKIVKSKEAFRDGRVALRTKDYLAAKQHFDAAVAREPNNVEYTAYATFAGFKLGQEGGNERIRDKYLSELETLGENQPNTVSVLYFLGVAYMELNRQREGRLKFDEVLALDPRHEEAKRYMNRLDLKVATQAQARRDELDRANRRARRNRRKMKLYPAAILVLATLRFVLGIFVLGEFSEPKDRAIEVGFYKSFVNLTSGMINNSIFFGEINKEVWIRTPLNQRKLGIERLHEVLSEMEGVTTVVITAYGRTMAVRTPTQTVLYETKVRSSSRKRNRFR